MFGNRNTVMILNITSKFSSFSRWGKKMLAVAMLENKIARHALYSRSVLPPHFIGAFSSKSQTFSS